MSGLKLTDDFILSKETSLGELADFFKRYNAAISTLKIGDCLIVVAWGRESTAAVKQAVEPLLAKEEL